MARYTQTELGRSDIQSVCNSRADLASSGELDISFFLRGGEEVEEVNGPQRMNDDEIYSAQGTLERALASRLSV